MHTIRRALTRALSILSVLAIAVAAFAIPASATSGSTIADTAIAVSSLDGFDNNDQDFDVLIQALIAADLVDAVADPGADLTVFAPTDRAFIRLARDLGYRGNDEAAAFGVIVEALTALGGGDPIPVLTNVLLYHVSPGSTSFADLKAARSAEVATLLGESFTANRRQLVDAAPQLRNPYIKRALTDINASNGVIHGINRVLVPVDVAPAMRDIRSDAGAPAPTANIVETAIAVSSADGFDANKDDFDILITAVVTADLAAALSDAGADLTVFAPTDRAFGLLARDLGYKGKYDEARMWAFLVDALSGLSSNGDPIPVLTNVLLYHVAPQSISFADVRSARSVAVPTLLGSELRVNVRQIVDAAPSRQDARILPALTDVNTSNGVIHGINRVLLPLDI